MKLRLWHKDLISFLPKSQILGQWRELFSIIKNIQDNGTSNHILVNNVMNYDMKHLITYINIVREELKNRGYKITQSSVNKLNIFIKDYCKVEDNNYIDMVDLFEGWHNGRYFLQCLLNLQEKYDCNGISKEEWRHIYNQFEYYFNRLDEI